MVREFRELKIWKKAIEVSKKVYLLTKIFPDDEKFGLVSQLRRASVSVSSNIAEGCGRRTNRDLANFLDIALGSVREIESQLYLAKELGFLGEVELDELSLELEELGKMISGFRGYVLKE